MFVLVSQPMCIAVLLIAIVAWVSSVRASGMIVDCVVVMMPGLSICIVLIMTLMIVAGLHCVSVLILLMVVVIVVVLMVATVAAVCVVCDIDDVAGCVCVDLCADGEYCVDCKTCVFVCSVCGRLRLRCCRC